MPEGQPVFVPLAAEPYLKFESGAKTVEFRKPDSPVARQVLKDPTPGRPVILALGYGKTKRLMGRLGSVVGPKENIHKFTPSWIEAGALGDDWAFFERDEPLIAFEVLGAHR